MQNDIDLFIMPPHYLYILQPFDVDIFVMFKWQHIIKIYIINRLNLQRIPHTE